jgi:hypothetical protein
MFCPFRTVITLIHPGLFICRPLKRGITKGPFHNVGLISQIVWVLPEKAGFIGGLVLCNNFPKGESLVRNLDLNS